MTPTLAELFDSLPQRGRVTWLGSRPARRVPLAACATLVLDAAGGIVGDHYAGRSGRRQVTLVQHEHLAVIAALLADARPTSPAATVDPALLRRNVVDAARNGDFSIFAVERIEEAVELFFDRPASEVLTLAREQLHTYWLATHPPT